MTPTLLKTDPELLVIEKFAARISDTIWLIWGYQECENYLFKLMFDSRDGRRQGFPADVAMAIMILHSRHQSIFEFEAVDIWASAQEFREVKGW